MRPLLEFDDAGAGVDEPTKGVTIGDIRAWHDEMEKMRQALEMIRDADDDCRRDGLPTIPPSARAKIDAALSAEFETSQ